MLVIHNPTAGRRRVHHLWRVLDILMGHGVRLEVVETRWPGHASVLARDAARAGVRLVVAAGGDGTIAEVAGGMLGAEGRLGIIPLGTANVLAHELRLGFAASEIAATLVSGRVATLRPGVARSAAGSRLFVQMLGIGFDAHVVHHLSRPVKRIIGRGAYVVQTIRELPRYGFETIELEADGVAYRAGSVIVCKGMLYGGPYMLAPEAQPGLPGFSVVLFERAGIASALRAGAALPLNRMARLPGVTRLRARHVAFAGAGGLPAQSDGDAAGCTPLDVSDANASIDVLVGASPARP
ncbi:diacylglycerol/lipid kinase family protein [Lichenicoccus sp.]|uniref:diacylglycerol/lipid kinase family protein n=1 Tax=Lichenicoccus sp. TaxID=2781899 RepID=UPI003D0C93F3